MPVVERKNLSALPILSPGAETWELAESWLLRSIRAGHRFGFADLLIAALAAEKDLSVWSLDHDFARMRQQGLVRLFEP